MRLLWLADVLRAAGVLVVERPGWRDRGKDLDGIMGVVWHHDAAAVTATNSAVEGLLERGRSDLPGPLCQLALRRDGTWIVIAAGRANHNGYGTWGNQSIGIEARNDGVGQSWPDVQIESWVTGTAALLRRLHLDATNVMGHKETDPRRKIDPRGVDMDQVRLRIHRELTTPQPKPEPQLEVEEDDMAKIIRRIKTGGMYTITGTHIRPWPGATRAYMDGLAKLTGQPYEVSDVSEEHWAALTGNLQDTRTGRAFDTK